MRIDFDTLEVYNGYESRTPERVEQCCATGTRSSTSGTATPRPGAATRTASSTTGPATRARWRSSATTRPAIDGAPIDTQAVVARDQEGPLDRDERADDRALELGGAHPGDEVTTEDAR